MSLQTRKVILSLVVLSLILTICASKITKAEKEQRFQEAQSKREWEEVAKIEYFNQEVATLRQTPVTLLFPDEDELNQLIRTSDYLFVVFYDPAVRSKESLEDIHRQIQPLKPGAVVAFVNAKEKPEIAKNHTVRYQPTIKIFSKGVPYVKISESKPVTVNTLQQHIDDLNVSPNRKWRPDSLNNLKRFRATTKEDKFHLVCLCEANSTEYQQVKEFSGIDNFWHDVHVMDPRDKEQRDFIKASNNPLNQVILVNKYRRENVVIPQGKLASPLELHNFLIDNKFPLRAKNVYEVKNAEELKNEVNPFVLVVDPEKRPVDLEVLESLGTAVAPRMKVYWARTSIEKNLNMKDIGLRNDNSVAVYIIENMWAECYKNVFKMTEAFSKDNLLGFYQSYKEDKIKPINPMQNDHTQKTEISGWKLLDQESYFNFVNDKTKDSVILYLKGCDGSECRKKLSVFKKVSTRMSQNTGIQFGVVDLNQVNLLDFVRTGDGPYFYLHPAGNPRDLRDWGFGREPSDETMIAFLKSQTTQPWVGPTAKIREGL